MSRKKSAKLAAKAVVRVILSQAQNLLVNAMIRATKLKQKIMQRAKL